MHAAVISKYESEIQKCNWRSRRSHAVSSKSRLTIYTCLVHQVTLSMHKKVITMAKTFNPKIMLQETMEKTWWCTFAPPCLCYYGIRSLLKTSKDLCKHSVLAVLFSFLVPERAQPARSSKSKFVIYACIVRTYVRTYHVVQSKPEAVHSNPEAVVVTAAD